MVGAWLRPVGCTGTPPPPGYCPWEMLTRRVGAGEGGSKSSVGSSLGVLRPPPSPPHHPQGPLGTPPQACPLRMQEAGGEGVDGVRALRRLQ